MTRSLSTDPVNAEGEQAEQVSCEKDKKPGIGCGWIVAQAQDGERCNSGDVGIV